jgi:ribonuclease G
MKREIIINSEPDETRVAVLENQQLVEFLVERAQEQSIVGNCYKGRVTTILPGMQAAFVDIGLEKAGFLHVDDVLYDMLEEEKEPRGGEARGGGESRNREPRAGGASPSAGSAPAAAQEALPGEHLSAAESTASAPPSPSATAEDVPAGMEEMSDIAPLDTDYDEEEVEEDENAPAEVKKEQERRREKRHRFRGRRPGIQDLLKRGQEIMVQVAKDPISTKGPRLTTRVSLAGRSLVLMPLSNNSGVSRKIADSERGRMKQIARKIKPAGVGIIIRTLGSGEGEEELRFEVEALMKRWVRVKKGFDTVKAPVLLYKEEGLTDRILRETLSKDVERIVVDHPEDHQSIQEYVVSFGLGKDVKVEAYKDKLPIFDHYNLEKEIEKALRERVWLHSGGYLVIQHTEALTVVDVNTGKFVGKRSQGETIFRTNLEAAVEVARQLRLRDIGGIIVIDFIDMDIEDHKEKVYLALAEAIKRDKAKTNILQLTDLGLIEMTRKRVKQSLVKELCEPCPYCGGKGIIHSELTTALRALRLCKRVALQTPEKQVLILTHPAISAILGEDNGRRLRDVEARYGLTLSLANDYHMHREDIKLLSARSKAEIRIPE